MRLLADENFPGHVVLALRNAGHDVAWVRLEAPGMSDDDVLRWARREGRILMTFDKDFGEMAFRSELDHPLHGVNDLVQDRPSDSDELVWLHAGLLQNGAKRTLGKIARVVRDGRVSVGAWIEPDLVASRRLSVEAKSETAKT